MAIRTVMLCCGLICGFLGTVRGDTFVLTSGGQIEGELVNRDEQPRRSFVVQTSGGQLTFAAARVQRVLTASEAERRYHELLDRMPDTADGHWKMAQWCGTQGLESERTFHLEETIRRDPDHAPARGALGYGQFGGRWLKTDERMREQGFVWVQGVWRLPQDAAAMELERANENAERAWRQKIKTWKSWIGKRRDAEARDEFKAIRDPLAVPAVVELLADDGVETDLRRLLTAVLGKVQTPAAATALIERLLYDSEPQIRSAAEDRLCEFTEKKAIVRRLVAELHKKDVDNKHINRAAEALGRMGDTEAVLPLIDVLVTEHPEPASASKPNGALTLDFNNGSSGLSVGAPFKKPKLKKVNNTAVLAALVQLCEGQANLGYDAAAWREWWAAQHAPPRIDLRRDK